MKRVRLYKNAADCSLLQQIQQKIKFMRRRFRFSMALLPKRWHRSRRNAAIAIIVASLFALYYIYSPTVITEKDLDITRSVVDLNTPSVTTLRTPPRKVVSSREQLSAVKELKDVKSRAAIIDRCGLHPYPGQGAALYPAALGPRSNFATFSTRPTERRRCPPPRLGRAERELLKWYIENKLQEALKLDKGMGCEIPELDPFSREVTQFDKELPKIKCEGQDWVKCYHSKCRVIDGVKDNHKDITCTFRDILHHTDRQYTIGPPTQVGGDDVYELKESDHVKVACVGRRKDDNKKADWSGNTLGFRPVPPLPSPAGREDSFNVVIFGFDTTARNGFIRRMKKSWQALKDLGFTVMEGYNIIGDGTPAALFPILTGKNELELPDVRKSKHNNGSLDSFPFIFYKLKQDGYRTAYFEDMPNIGTFQYRFNGFRRQPADHYLRSFYLEDLVARPSPSHWWKGKKSYYCLGDTPQFKVMINITEQFLELGGKRFIFTFIADITHDDFNLIENADDDTAAFLHSLMSRAEDTLIVVMGDHGPRYANVRDTLQGKLEERLPLLALRLPARLARARPHAQRALAHNARALTTPHDLHSTILDVLDMRQHWNPYKVRGADYTRALTMLEPETNARALTTPHDLHSTILDVLDMRQHWNPYKVRGADYTRALTMLEPIPRNRSCSEAGIEPHWCACLAWQNVSTDDPFFEKTAKALLDYINSLVATVGDLCVPRSLTSTAWVLRQRANSRLLAFKNARDADGYVGHFDAKTKVANENYQVKIAVGPGHGIYEASMTYLVNEDKFMIHTRDISRTNAYRSEPDCISKTHPHLNPYCYCR